MPPLDCPPETQKTQESIDPSPHHPGMMVMVMMMMIRPRCSPDAPSPLSPSLNHRRSLAENQRGAPFPPPSTALVVYPFPPSGFLHTLSPPSPPLLQQQKGIELCSPAPLRDRRLAGSPNRRIAESPGSPNRPPSLSLSPRLFLLFPYTQLWRVECLKARTPPLSVSLSD
jgi:hypothetical protein